jgi:transposase-like protein
MKCHKINIQYWFTLVHQPCSNLTVSHLQTYHTCNSLLWLAFATEPRSLRYLHDAITSFVKDERDLIHYYYFNCAQVCQVLQKHALFNVVPVSCPFVYSSRMNDTFIKLTLMYGNVTSMSVAIHEGIFIPSSLVWTDTTSTDHFLHHDWRVFKRVLNSYKYYINDKKEQNENDHYQNYCPCLKNNTDLKQNALKNKPTRVLTIHALQE